MSEKTHGGRKRVLYFTDAAPLMIHGKRALDKIRKNLSYFESVSDTVELYWKPYEYMEEKLSPVNETLYEELCDMEKEFQNAGWGHYVSQDDVVLPEDMDAYVGDPGAYAYHISQLRKPTFITDDWSFDEKE